MAEQVHKIFTTHSDVHPVIFALRSSSNSPSFLPSLFFLSFFLSSYLTERFTITYGTGATTQRVVQTPVTIGSHFRTRGNLSLGAITENVVSGITNQIGFFHRPDQPCYNTWDGIMGLAGQSASPDSPPVIEQLARTENVLPTFSVFLCDWYPTNGTVTDLTRVGHLWLGGYPSLRLAAPLQYTPIQIEPLNWYVIQVAAVRVNGASVALPDDINSMPGVIDGSLGVVLDSGTTRIYLNTAANQNAMRAALSAALSVPAGTSSAALDAFWINMAPLPGATVNAMASLVGWGNNKI